MIVINIDRKTVGFFLKISKEIGKAWRKGLEVVISSFDPFPSDFEEGLRFQLHSGVGGLCRKRRPWSIE